MKLKIAKGIKLDLRETDENSPLEAVQQIGIENLKKVALYSVRLKQRIVQAKADGEIKRMEKFRIAITALGIFKLVPLWPQIVTEIKDLSEDEYDELVQVIANEFGFNSEDASDYFDIFMGLIDTLKMFLDI